MFQARKVRRRRRERPKVTSREEKRVTIKKRGYKWGEVKQLSENKMKWEENTEGSTLSMPNRILTLKGKMDRIKYVDKFVQNDMSK